MQLRTGLGPNGQIDATHTHTHTDIDRDNAGSEMEPLMEARRLLMNRVSPGLAEKQCGDSYD